MKKALYILPLLLFLYQYGYSQSTHSIYLTAYAETPDTHIQIDSAYVGDEINIVVTVENMTSGEFPSDGAAAMKIPFQSSVMTGYVDYAHKDKGILSPFTLTFKALSDFGYSSTSRRSVKVTSTDFGGDGNHVIIIWPTGGITDADGSDQGDKIDTSLHPYAAFKLKVLPGSGKSGLNEIATGNIGMNVYPNPATSGATVNVNGVHNGTLTITDISGKILVMQAVRGDGSSMNIPLPLNVNGNSLAEGLYFISLSTENAHCVQKLLISK